LNFPKDGDYVAVADKIEEIKDGKAVDYPRGDELCMSKSAKNKRKCGGMTREVLIDRDREIL
jgi:hypothetical protein